MTKPRLAVHKFSSCDGCQLAFLNAGEQLLQLAQLVDIVHFAEAGPCAPQASVDIAFVEGSINTHADLDRIRQIRANSKMLISIGACATAGGIQALRNLGDTRNWLGSVYAAPQYLDSLATATPIATHVPVDLEIWGCPVNATQVFSVVRQLLNQVSPRLVDEKVCMECKRAQQVCVMVTQGVPCLGAVTRSGCGAICPGQGRDCYACFGPAEASNTAALGQQLHAMGLDANAVARRFLFINSAAAVFNTAGQRWRDKSDA